MTYYLIGTGHMATFLAQRMQAAGHTCNGIYGRDRDKARRLALAHQVPQLAELRELHDGADACLLAVSDQAIEAVAGQLGLRTTVLIHHSGSMPLRALQQGAEHAGVVWPVYSVLRQDLPRHRHFPCIWEASSGTARAIVQEICTALSGIAYEADSGQRRWLHLTAVMGNNFTNYLYGMCRQLCDDHGLPFSLLQPILQQTLDRTSHQHPNDVQTGPARRGDTGTMEAHLGLLQDHPQWQSVYAALSAAIGQSYPPAADRTDPLT